MTMLSQETRIRRAREERDGYDLRSTKIAGSLAFYVINNATGSIYTVTTNGHHPRCNCPDYQKRCAGTQAKCKHLVMVDDLLAETERFFQEQGPQAAEQMTAAKRAQALKDRELWG